MLHASTQQLIRKLHELTEAGGLAWKEGAGETSRLDTEGYVVEVAASPPALRLLQGDGRELDKVSAEDLAAVAWPSGEGTYATRVAEMAARAHRIARGAEKAIATILSSLSAPALKPAPAPAPVQPVAAEPKPAAQPEPPKPAPVAAAPVPPPAPASAPPKPAVQTEAPAPFGDIASFAKTAPPPAAPAPAKPPEPAPPPLATAPAKPAEPVPPPAAPKKPAPDMLQQGISARSIQGVEQATTNDLQRLAPAAPQPAPAPAPTPTPAPTPRPAAATGPNVYKPWN